MAGRKLAASSCVFRLDTAKALNVMEATFPAGVG